MRGKRLFSNSIGLWNAEAVKIFSPEYHYHLDTEAGNTIKQFVKILTETKDIKKKMK